MCAGAPHPLGRGEKADVKVDDTLVSRVHVRIFQHENGSYLIEDLASRNGTQVNGMAVTRRVLTYGDRIQIGSSLLLFAHHDPMEEQVAQRRKLEAIGRLGTGVEHDFNNLLGAVRSSIDFLNGLPGETTVSEPEVREAFNDIRAGVEQSVTLPAGYHVEYGGQFESAEKASQTLLLLGLAVVVGIFLILFVAFGSARDASLVMVNLPLALRGRALRHDHANDNREASTRK